VRGPVEYEALLFHRSERSSPLWSPTLEPYPTVPPFFG
jgi:hypothetical protein